MVAGKSLKCKTVESTVESEDLKTWSKTWMSVEVPGRKGAVSVVERDETPRETTLESLAKLKPAQIKKLISKNYEIKDTLRPPGAGLRNTNQTVFIVVAHRAD